MDIIKKVLATQDSSLMDLINCFEQIKTKGEVVVIKFDGERLENGYTVFISFPDNKRSLIRADENDLKKAILKVLTKYSEGY